MRRALFALALLLAPAVCSAQAVGNGSPAPPAAPYVTQYNAVFLNNSNAGTLAFANTANSSKAYIIGAACTATGSTITTPTGYTLLGNGTGNSMQISVYYRAASGTSSDHMTLTQSAFQVIEVYNLEVDNAGVPIGFATSAQSGLVAPSTPTIATSAGELLFAFFCPNSSVFAFPSTPGWSGMQDTQFSNLSLLEASTANSATTVSTAVRFTSNFAGVTAIFGVPHA